VTELRATPEEKEKEKGQGSALGVFEEEPHHFSLWKEHAYDQGHQWGMTIDLNSCIGCNACMTACQSENNVPVVGKVQVAKGREMHWIRVDRYFSGEPPATRRSSSSRFPACTARTPLRAGLPGGRDRHDAQGLNVMVYNRCIGTRYCSNNCPYKVRRFNFFNFTKDTPDILKLAMNPDVTVARGASWRSARIARSGSIGGRSTRSSRGRAVRDGRRQDGLPAGPAPRRPSSCGDLRDPIEPGGEAKADPRNYALLEELNTKPRTTYLAKVRNPNPDLKGVPT
jgi:molybdopterin-containing oxidoreductase family iron-sulfur binding subunit